MSYAVGLDIGGTKIAAGVVDGTGAILAGSRRPTARTDEGAILADVVGLVTELAEQHPVAAVGVAAAGLVDADRSTVRFAPNLPWRDYPLGERLRDALGLPVLVENDASAAGWGEHRFGAGRDASEVLMVTLGTGIGGAIISEGRLLRGTNGFAAEVGHLRLVPGGHPCGCGRRGCWEQYASGSALGRAAREAVAADPVAGAALVACAGGAAEAITGEHVVAVARTGNTVALRLVDDLVVHLGVGIASLVAVLDPAVVVLGGGMASGGDFLLPRVTAAVAAEVTGPVSPSIRMAARGNDGGLVGAADLALAALR